MISALLIERWAWWRPVGVSVIVGLAAAPAFPMLWRAADAASLADALTTAFRSSLVNSTQVAILVAAAVLFMGLPLGALAAIYSFPFRKLMLMFQAMPLLLPSHLLAIGWSSIGIRLGISEWLAGFSGPVLVFSAMGVPLVVLTTLAACGSLTESQIEAARLSGGERALTSLALICSILANNPSPFVVLDEVDAALDEANSARLAEIIDQLSHRTQFIVITHNRAMMHQSNILYGVTMGDDGASKVLSLKLEEIVKE